MSVKRLLTLLRIQPKETKTVLYIFLLAFSIGITQNILYCGPLAMFLARYNSSFLSYIYIFSGISIFFMGLIFAYFQQRVSYFKILSIPIILFSISLASFWGVLFFTNVPWVFTILVVWSFLAASIMGSIVMWVNNILFTFQQSKRIYGLVVAGNALGGITLGFLMTPLVHSIGSHNIILLSALILFFGFVMQLCIKRNAEDRFLTSEKRDGTNKSEVSLQCFKHGGYIFSILIITVLIYFIHYSFDLLFNSSVQRRFPSEVEMASFYGVLYAVYNMVSLFVALSLSEWLLSRLGLIVSLLLWPIGLVIFLSAVFIVHLDPSAVGVLFAILLVSAIFDVGIRETVTEESILLLFQPLRPMLRTWAQITNETIVFPLAAATIGIILVVIKEYFGVNTSVMSFMIIGLSLAIIALLLFIVKKGYLTLLLESLSKRILVNPEFIKLDKENLTLLKSRLSSRYPEEVIYILQTIEKLHKEEFEKAVASMLDSALQEVRCFSLNKVEQYRMKSVADKLKKTCLEEKNPQNLGYALRALGSVTDWDDLPWFKNYINDSNVEVAGNSIIALIKYGSEDTKKELIESLTAKAKSSKEEERLIAADVLKSVDIPTKSDLLMDLLRDPNLDVRIVASEATATTTDERLYPALIENVMIPHVCDAAFNSMVQLGKPMLDYIARQFDSLPTSVKVELVNLIGFIKVDGAVDFLQKLLSIARREVLHATLTSLKRLSYRAKSDVEHNLIKSLLQSENTNVIALRKKVVFFGAEETRLLYDLLCREIELSQECCFLLLSFVYSESQITDAQQGLSVEDEEMNSNAIELLLQILNKIDQELLMEQLIYSPYSGEHEEQFDRAKIEELLPKIIDYTSQSFMPALAAAVVYTIGMLQVKTLEGFVQKQEPERDALMKEAVSLALKRLEIAG